MSRQIYLIGEPATKENEREALVLWKAGFFTDRHAAGKMAKELGYKVIPLRKNPTQP